MIFQTKYRNSCLRRWSRKSFVWGHITKLSLSRLFKQDNERNSISFPKRNEIFEWDKNLEVYGTFKDSGVRVFFTVWASDSIKILKDYLQELRVSRLDSVQIFATENQEHEVLDYLWRLSFVWDKILADLKMASFFLSIYSIE